MNRASIDHDLSLPDDNLGHTALSALAPAPLMTPFIKSSLPLDSVEGVLDPPDLVTDLVVLLHDLVHLCYLLLHPLVDHSHSVAVHLRLRIDLLVECHYIQGQFLSYLVDVFDHVVSQFTYLILDTPLQLVILLPLCNESLLHKS